ncbi:tRNA (adenosine(37)-N6)-dimethylallyltransferase MiaA [Sulfitobacter donghicola]|uniref:tRNA dimethylallyltransferase n=1 Tax=Sulfitobacter donghicola DSW-25 = KCTC 12864 = JCM 14565 TaxID=1300350 RepID=A0A073IF12_9RHOB|nr:tRNA (adenosine(37)-N6)-dimethylallyltransferase MiaA [Sulfitobacter donghicola]KEJ88359.1 tRNA delta(2)-isopentenylpyrophosphate transferase [Sulfitobacter donghicola DSW-25 = KCTC 12864 = JCM 14565]KIN69777.1 tRNA dimethylallyltransferase [Sulfitobacter donghicola DSW-25 = KCTC 12864 = JCM 14565]
MSQNATAALLASIPPTRPVLIAGPTASGKSALALEIAKEGGVIVNADASQVYGCWRVISARPSAEEEAQAPHRLYGHLAEDAPYSTGHWLREVAEIIAQGQRPILVGGTGLYFQALTEGLADIPQTPVELREHANTLPLQELIQGLDAATAAGIDLANRARVQRAWEVLEATGKGLSQWQSETPAPLLNLSDCTPIALDVDRDWLAERIERRFDLMIAGGALDEVRAIAPHYNPRLPAHKAIGVPELLAYLRGTFTLEEARDAAIIATRQYAKRQRTWIRSKMGAWQKLILPE